MFQLLTVLALSALGAPEAAAPTHNDPLMDWSPWEKYRTTIVHPAVTVKAADLGRAQENIRQYAWARAYRDQVVKGAGGWLARLTPEYLVRMIPATTPGDTLFTPCPACRELGKPMHPAGQWRWSSQKPEELTCVVCGTVFPNEKYPEAIELHAKHGGGQTISYCGGEPFKIFSYTGRPSFTGAIRAHKVRFMIDLGRRLGEAYALGRDPEHARAARLILLRLAEVYPGWMVHTGYGEYADLDPHVAARRILALPADELCPPPNVPDRKLFSGYWQGGRASGVGMEGVLIRRMVEAYDFVCDAPDSGQALFSEADRRKIEKDLLLEGTVLLAADKAINNKSVGNAAAVTLVGMSLGHPAMVRFGLDVFQRTVDGWFLSDGGTPESWGYATMTLSGIECLGQAFRGYSDPPGYRDAEGKRLDGLDLYHQTAYGKVWTAMFNGLQGDLAYPPLADGHLHNAIGSRFAELMADNYPDNPQFLALLKVLAGNDPRRGDSSRGKAAKDLQLLKTQTGDELGRGDAACAVYYRPTGLDKRPSAPLALPDYVFPVLSIGYLRSGATGRDGATILSASDWGGHHHLDSLNLYYWRQGHELLSDLGYLWDHPQIKMTRRTLAHNTVLVDEQEQITKGRGGRFLLFHPASPVKVMEAESRAYSQATLYRRCVVQVEHAPGRQYVADIFRVRGGGRHDYVFHGPHNDPVVDGPELVDWSSQPAVYDFTRVRGSKQSAAWRITWTISPQRRFSALWFSPPGESTLLGTGWGQRDYRNTDVGAVLPYIVRRREAAKQPSVYAGVFEDYEPGQALCRSMRVLSAADGDNTVVLVVDTDRGADYLVLSIEPRLVRVQAGDGSLEACARFAMVSIQQGRPKFSSLVEGTVLRWNGKDLKQSAQE